MAATLGFRVLGHASNPRELVSYPRAMRLYAAGDESVRPELPAFLSAFSFPAAFREFFDANGGSTAGYTGPIGVPYLHFDVDRDDLAIALQDTRRLAGCLADRYAVEPLVHFSGAKGFHLAIATGGFIEPAPDNHAIARTLALRLADQVGVMIDEGVYLATQLWRAANSRHPRSGLYKIRIDADALPYVGVDQVRRLAAHPIPYALPESPSPPPRLVADWNSAARMVRGERQGRRRQAHRNAVNGEARTRVNCLTLQLLNDPTSVRIGSRHRTILSAAADLASFPTVDELIAALLTTPGCDTGLPPKDVSRQIACGIAMAGRRRIGERGAAPS
jgi:hypothetical protein